MDSAKTMPSNQIETLQKRIQSLERELKHLNIAQSNINKAHKKLIESERRIQKILHSALDAVVVINDKGIITNWNPQAEVIFGYTLREVLGKTIASTIIPEKYRKDHHKGFDHYLRTGIGPALNTRMKLTGLHKNGHEFPIELTIIPNKLYGRIFFSAFIRDLSEQVKLDRALKTSEEKYRNLVKNSPLCIHEIDMNGKLVSMNQAGLDMIGAKDNSEISGLKYLDFPSKIDKKKVAKLLKEASKGKTSEFEFSTDGSKTERRYYKSNFIPIKNETGQVSSIMGISEDITQRKKSEEALIESEKHSRRIVDNSPHPVTVHTNQKFVYVNSAAINLFAAKSAKQLIGRNVLDFVHPSFKKIAKSRIKKLELSGGNVPILQEKFIRIDKKEIDVEVNGITIDFNGKPSILASLTDVTQRNTYETALKESEERFRCIVDNSPHPMAVHSKGIILYANDACVKVLEANTADDLVGRSILDIAHESSKKFAAARIKTLIKKGGKTKVAVEKLITLKGKIIDAEVVGMLMKYNDIPAILVTINDITERNKFEAQLKESEERYRSLFENAHDLIQSVDMNGDFLFVNKSWRKTLGYSKKDLSSMKIVDVIHPDSMNHCMMLMQKVFKGKLIKNFETKFIGKNGNIIEVEGNASPRIIDGKVVATQGFFRDVTKRNELMQELINEKNKRIFETMHTQEEERHRIATELHDGLGQILTGISFNIDNIKNDLESTGRYKKKVFSDIQCMIKNAINETKDIAYNLTPATLHDLGLKPALKQLCNTMSGKGKVKIDLDCANFKEIKNNNLNICLYRIVQEALNNVIKHSKAKKASVQIFKSKKSIFLVIEDSGKGFNVDQSKKKTSMGLHNISDRVESFNGKFKINSDSKFGTEIIIEVPQGNK
ncbi:MAG: PAS domain S-box protein [Bacteroidia bacterium]|nr:PAS domain S-box protein [Bacteroidia bacterium]